MKQLSLTQELYEYLLDISLREHPVLAKLRVDAENLQLANMQIAPEQAQFMQFLLRMLKAKKVLELGTFRGYSALAMALALPDDGELITCDSNAEWTKNTHLYWQEAEQEKKIKLKLAPALTTLEELINSGHKNSFDFIFIDADKTNYINYYNYALRLIKPSGVIAVDNIFWDAKVIDPSDISGQTSKIRRFNELIKNDKRVDVSCLAIADGLFLIRPK